LYTAAYNSVSDALADLNAVEQLHKDDVIGQYDAAVIDKQDGKPHIAKRTARASASFPSGSAAGRCPARSSRTRRS
jgi:uncharacterized membrane protein